MAEREYNPPVVGKERERVKENHIYREIRGKEPDSSDDFFLVTNARSGVYSGFSITGKDGEKRWVQTGSQTASELRLATPEEVEQIRGNEDYAVFFPS